MLKSWDIRRDYFVGDTKAETIQFAIDHWIHSAKRAIQKKNRFAVALSGGSTPKVIYEGLALRKIELDWSKIFLFWSDERAVPPDDPESNFAMAMKSFHTLPIPPSQIFRMQAEENIEKNSLSYEEKIHHYLGKDLFDLVMLGVGEDGHTASLFPETDALSVTNRLVIPNYLPTKKTWRMTLSFPCIEKSSSAVFYVLGENKQSIVSAVLKAPLLSSFPASAIGTPEKKALWILDKSAANQL